MTEDSFSAPTSAPSINKIPFLVFDAILVIAAVVLAITAGGPLSPLLFFWILLCVVVGGVVACLPFWIEFRDKVRLSEYEIRERQNSAHDAQWQYVDARLIEQNEYLQKLHLRLADSAERLASLEARPPTPTADEIAALCSSGLQKQWPQWQEELLGVLSKRTDILFNEQNAQNAKLSAAQENRIADLRKEFASVETLLLSLDARIGEIALLSAAGAATALSTHSTERATANADKNNPATEAPVTGGQAADSIQTLVSEQENDEGEAALYEDEEDGFLNADDFADEDLDDEDLDDGDFADEDLDQSEDPSDESLDVSGLDDAEDLGEDELYNEDPANAEDAEEIDTDEDGLVTEDELTAAGTTESALSESAESALSTPHAKADENTGADQNTRPDTDAGVDAAVDAPADTAVSEAAIADSAPAAPQQPALLETPEPPARPKKTANSDKTTLVAQVLIGIGNKPYVRGTGPGLSMDKGVPMQFVEIGKWEWVCPSGTEPVKILIYKNDETPSNLGEIELEAGQRRAVTPTFAR